mmetsp:Transcript_106291/g.317633  ORF Transcript_106291/g.317633 Transcript_106291/m.317633 type:complete len:240 (-) Transcript_106291:14-733(-)
MRGGDLADVHGRVRHVRLLVPEQSLPKHIGRGLGVRLGEARAEDHGGVDAAHGVGLASCHAPNQLLGLRLGKVVGYLLHGDGGPILLGGGAPPDDADCRHGAGVHVVLHAGELVHRAQDVAHTFRGGLDHVLHRVLDLSRVHLSCGMDHCVHAGDCLVVGPHREEIGRKQLDLPLADALCQVKQKLVLGIGLVAHAGVHGVAPLQALADDVRPDEPRCSSDSDHRDVWHGSSWRREGVP